MGGVGTENRRRAVFFFFSNRLGCAGSLLLTALGTLVLLAVMGLVRF
jgi:hypothetical protein